jgi:hypothetical protein
MKNLIIIVGIVIVVGGGTYYYLHSTQNTTSTTVTVKTDTPTQETKPVVASTTSGSSTLPTGTKASNEDLSQDLSSIDSQLSNLNSDTTKAGQSLKDQQVSQSAL